MKRFKSLFLLLFAMLMLTTCASPAYAFSDENAEQEAETTPSQALTPEGNMALVGHFCCIIFSILSLHTIIDYL